MDKRTLGKTGLEIVPLVFGGNVFGWTLDEAASFKMLDAIVDRGLNTIDTADVYSRWAPGNQGGESETIMGKWLKQNPNKRDQLLILTKVGSDMGNGNTGLSRRWIMEAVEQSLKRLQIDVIDLYQSHFPDPSTSYEETLTAFEDLIKQGKVRAIGASNLSLQQVTDALQTAKQHQLTPYQTLQPEYNLYDRKQFDDALRQLVIKENIGVISYYSLASGFLSGKYRSKDDLAKGPRGEKVAEYMNDKGMRILTLLDELAQKYETSSTVISLAWILAQPGITAPIVSATSIQQLDQQLHALSVHLSDEDVTLLNQAGI